MGNYLKCLIPLLYVVRVRHEVTSLFGHPQQSMPPTPLRNRFWSRQGSTRLGKKYIQIRYKNNKKSFVNRNRNKKVYLTVPTP